MRRRRWLGIALGLMLLGIVLGLVLLSTLLTPIGVLADGPDATVASMEGMWTITVRWVDPAIIGDYNMSVSMVTSSLGRISTESHTGVLLTNGQAVLWTIDQPWVALYVGQVTSSSGSGWMANRAGNRGTWTATKTASAPPTLQSGLEIGAAPAD